MTAARLAAARALIAITARRATMATAVEEARRGLADERDRALALELVAGTLRCEPRGGIRQRGS
jgi:hypothetical protein